MSAYPPTSTHVAPPMSIMSRSMMLGPSSTVATTPIISHRQRHAHRYRDEMDLNSSHYQQQQQQQQQLGYQNHLATSPFPGKSYDPKIFACDERRPHIKGRCHLR